MEIQVSTNQQGIRNLYFGHPFSKETYTNSFRLKTPVPVWQADFDGVYSGKVIDLIPKDSVELPSDDDVEHSVEHRVVRGTKVMFIGDYEKVLEMSSDLAVYKDLCNLAMVKVNNPDYLDFDVYTKKILKDPLKNIFEMKSVTPELAKKYMDYATYYDRDKKYSDRLILKPYFTSCDSGVLLLTEDFSDFNLDLTIYADLGVVSAKVWLSENTSKYTHNYKEI